MAARPKAGSVDGSWTASAILQSSRRRCGMRGNAPAQQFHLSNSQRFAARMVDCSTFKAQRVAPSCLVLLRRCAPKRERSAGKALGADRRTLGVPAGHALGRLRGVPAPLAKGARVWALHCGRYELSRHQGRGSPGAACKAAREPLPASISRSYRRWRKIRLDLIDAPRLKGARGICGQRFEEKDGRKD